MWKSLLCVVHLVYPKVMCLATCVMRNLTVTLRDAAPYKVWETEVVQGWAISNGLVDGTLLAKLSLDFSMVCILLHWLWVQTTFLHAERSVWIAPHHAA